MAAEVARTGLPAATILSKPADRLNNEVGSCESRESAGRDFSSSKDALWSGDGGRQATVPGGLSDAARGGGEKSRGFEGGVGGGGGGNDGNGDDENGNGGDEDEVEVEAREARVTPRTAKLTPRYSLPNRNPDGSRDTLSLDNLPTDIPSLDEHLKALFSIQPGYQRMCYRTKRTGVLCFVQFNDVDSATKALEQLSGHVLQSPSAEEKVEEVRLQYAGNSLGIRL